MDQGGEPLSNGVDGRREGSVLDGVLEGVIKSKRVTFKDLSEYIINGWNEDGLEGHILKLAAHVSSDKSVPYNDKQFVKAHIPLPVLVTLLARSTSIGIANQHNIHLNKKHLVVKDIQLAFQSHSCSDCPVFHTIFSVLRLQKAAPAKTVNWKMQFK